MFDEVRKDHPWAKEHRIPVLVSYYPRFNYEMALCVPDENGSAKEFNLWNVQHPGDDALPILSSFLDYRLNAYEEYYRQRIREQEFDVQESANTVTFGLTPRGQWQYRLRSWRGDGPTAVGIEGDYRPGADGLVALIDKKVTHGSPYWTEWKSLHPSVFAL